MTRYDYLRKAYEFATMFSDDPDTKNGALIVTTDGQWFYGANRIPSGVAREPERMQRPLKYTYVEHAERDAIQACCRQGVSTIGATMYCPWSACTECAKAIIGAGITNVVVHGRMMEKTPERWAESVQTAWRMMLEAGIALNTVNGTIGDCEALFDGQKWYP